MKLPCLLQFRILKQAVQALFARPFTTAYPAEPYQPPETFRGRPRFHERDCIGCGACAEVCPPKCIDVVDDAKTDPPRRRLVQHADACIWCGQCERYCPTREGIKLSNEFVCVGFAPEDFEESVEKELVRCEVCGEIIAPLDQLRWIAERLGPLAFANPSLLMTLSRDLGIVDRGVNADPADVRRSERLDLQCPRCRRRTALVV
jgi:hydrogenase-4 component H